MLETQQINRAMAEALTAQGFAEDLAWKAVVVHASCKARDRLDETHWNPPVIMVEKGVYRCGVTGPTWVCNGEIEPQDVELIPHNFTDPRYLWPAFEAYFNQAGSEAEWRWYRNSDRWEVGLEMWVRGNHRYVRGEGATLGDALRHAFAAALGVNT